MDRAYGERRTSNILLETTDKTKYNAAIQHPFLEAARTGTLNSELLSLWLSQDRIYAAHGYPRFIGALIAKIPFSHQHRIGAEADAKNQRILSVLSYALQNVVREANFFLDIAQKYGFDLESWKERGATKAYCAEMARVASWGSLEEGLVFLWAMEKLYLDSWSFVHDGLTKQISADENINTASEAVQEFAQNWTNDEFIKFVEELREIVDGLDISPDSEGVKAVWDRVVELEIEFWPQVGEEKREN